MVATLTTLSWIVATFAMDVTYCAVLTLIVTPDWLVKSIPCKGRKSKVITHHFSDLMDTL